MRMLRATESLVYGTYERVDAIDALESIFADVVDLEINRADDLIPEESDSVLLALKRLPPKEAYDRVFRLRRAFQVRISPPY